MISALELMEFRPKGGYPAPIRLTFTDGSIYEARVPVNPLGMNAFRDIGEYDWSLPTRESMYRACAVYAGATARDALRGRRIRVCQPAEVNSLTAGLASGGDSILGVGFQLEGRDDWLVLYGAEPDAADIGDSTHYFDSQCPLYLARLHGTVAETIEASHIDTIGTEEALEQCAEDGAGSQRQRKKGNRRAKKQ